MFCLPVFSLVSVQFSHSVVSDSLRPHELQHARPPCPSPTPGVYSNLCSLWHPTPVLLPGKSHGQRSLVGCSPWGHWESGTTERLHFHFSVSCIGEGNPRDGGAWWAAVYGVAQSWTRLKRLSSSSSSR